ncbi:MAG: MBL fold metallo-hydrolase, partial [Burkholderiales bacterium]|nr:MBL fold metallo-hydrolase [Burkholderiales bacterium]
MAYRTLITLTALVSASMATAAGNDVDDSVARVVEVATGVYVRPGKHSVVFEGEDIANIGFIVGERCVAVIDTGGSYSEGQALLGAIRQITPLPVCYVINTH